MVAALGSALLVSQIYLRGYYDYVCEERAIGIVSIVTLTCCLTASIVSLPALVLEMERWSRSAP